MGRLGWIGRKERRPRKGEAAETRGAGEDGDGGEEVEEECVPEREVLEGHQRGEVFGGELVDRVVVEIQDAERGQRGQRRGDAVQVIAGEVQVDDRGRQREHLQRSNAAVDELQPLQPVEDAQRRLRCNGAVSPFQEEWRHFRGSFCLK